MLQKLKPNIKNWKKSLVDLTPEYVLLELLPPADDAGCSGDGETGEGEDASKHRGHCAGDPQMGFTRRVAVSVDQTANEIDGSAD